jgi:Domain of unknown function (DUF4438), N-terminal/Domain of unknown function (DUF4438), C-terminal
VSAGSGGPRARGSLRAVAVNMLGIVEHPALAGTPYRVDADGRPYLPVGDGGLVLGVRLGDPVSALAGDHVAPGACLVHPDPAARHALVSYGCIGNPAEVRSGRAAGARGVVLGKRGEDGRLITGFRQQDLARMRPGDQVNIRASGQGWRHPGVPPEVTVLNAAPGLLAALPVLWPGHGPMTVGVRATLPSKLAGNGIGRPAAAWDLDLQFGASAAGGGTSAVPLPGADGLLLGDLVAVADIDTRHDMGYRRGWVTVGVVVHGASPLPGHGPGLTPVLTGPGSALSAVPDAAGHRGLTESGLGLQ